MDNHTPLTELSGAYSPEESAAREPAGRSGRADGPCIDDARGETLQYAVLRFADGWRILCKGWKAGRFDTRQAAVCAAERLAREARALGSPVEFLVQSTSGELELRPLPRSGSRGACRPDLSVRRRVLSDSHHAARPAGP